jgi:hypothetical protein
VERADGWPGTGTGQNCSANMEILGFFFQQYWQHEFTKTFSLKVVFTVARGADVGT